MVFDLQRKRPAVGARSLAKDEVGDKKQGALIGRG
jgi:hypothetical protein